MCRVFRVLFYDRIEKADLIPELGGLAPLRETSATQGKEEFFTRRREGAKKPTRWFEVEDFAKHIPPETAELQHLAADTAALQLARWAEL